MVSELEPFWLCWSAADDAALEDDAEVDEGLAFSLKSVMMTVRSPTVTSRCWALLRSMFFNLGLQKIKSRKKCRKITSIIRPTPKLPLKKDLIVISETS